MKFPQLPLGARFEFEGKTYVKTGPVAATASDGQQRLIPRWAALKLLDGPTPAPPPLPVRKLDEEQVMAAFEAYHACSLSLVAGQEEAEQTLHEARKDFLNALRGPARPAQDEGRPE